MQKSDTPYVIPHENIKMTTGWKYYLNREFHFSFKYPEGLLSNFVVNTTDLGNTTLNSLKSIAGSAAKNASEVYTYNVVFEAGAIKHAGSLDNFIQDKLPETRGSTRQRIELNDIEGIRITNVKNENDVYFLYNIFKINDVIYNFAIFSDDPILIDANKPLLDNILATAKFE